MLTTALNKSPKPPIIVDDIIVTELNLGSTPPELEILEIGDLAEDRFRGIFKMSYTGDAYLTLKTRVQANPLNTYLSTKPPFASPQPLAASAGLTIPLQITLSDIRLSGFVILVFSRQKGITLVFRNDPLESLKVSSTFDSIPFVRDYLQKEIEGQLRVLFMEDLPAIIHRLSLRLWSSEYSGEEEEEERFKSSQTSKNNEQPIDPLASPPMNAVDAFGRPLDDADLPSFSMDTSAETHATFSQKNLLRLAALTDSHRTLSLFTPPIRDAVFRAWAGAAERGDLSGTSTPTFALSSGYRQQSTASSTLSSSVYSFSDGGAASSTSRPSSLSSLHSSYGSTYAGKSRSHPTRQRKNRVVDLRKSNTESAPVAPSAIIRPSTPTPSITFASQCATGTSSEDRDGEVDTPQRSPEKNKARVRIEEQPQIIHSPRPHSLSPSRPTHDHQSIEPQEYPRLSAEPSASSKSTKPMRPSGLKYRGPSLHLGVSENNSSLAADNSSRTFPSTPLSAANGVSSSGGILEQAWMMKMATEIARKVRYEKEASAAGDGVWRERGEDVPPPAYAA